VSGPHADVPIGGTIATMDTARKRRIEPSAGQESVWDYPRPPRMQATGRHLVVVFADLVIAESTATIKVMETASPPTYYVPAADVRADVLVPSDDRSTFCEWKGRARYFDILVGDRTAPRAAWTYPEPHRAFTELAGYIAFYPALMDAALVDGEQARPQPGGYYGGWITDDVVGPFKGAPGTEGW
jgi:uncharacterized protein (DUF427 family)